MQSTSKQGTAKGRKQISWRKTQRSVYRTFRYPDGSEKEEHFPLRPAIRHKGITIREIPLNDAGTSYECDIPAQISDKRNQKRFKTKDEAIAFAEQAVIRRENKGLEGFRINNSQLQDALEAISLLDGRDTLAHAVQFFIKHQYPEKGDITLQKLQAEFLSNQRIKERRPATLRENESRIESLVAHFGEQRLVKDVTAEELRKHLNDPGWGAPTKKSHYANSRAFLNYAVEEKYLQRNPIDDVKPPTKPKYNKPGILTTRQTETLLETILSADNGNLKFIGPYVTLGLFCGIRTNELDQLNWEDIRLDKKYVAIFETIAKKHRARNVDIMPNAIQWLHAFGIDESGPIRKPNHRRTFESAQKASNIGAWPKNAMRHSYASYLYEMTGDETKVINQLGQRSVDVMFTHYRTLTNKGEGTEYFSITPPEKADNLVSFPNAKLSTT
jgi:integrase